ncbi:maleylpyruvate isomerase family mycothiol-dependent enzyme [Streptomyces sp. FZ201]|uniref:maleylpyruvate isomerase family mycothiol-dependent enzyme n=1 Tax=Streptomyces sp. FZ201 TaxID=3057122 RepID=UPI0021C18C0B|nr:maleylpyruvate isomerase family mycothiol-dependent enzyme [Streptomyces sp. FZ201]
MTEHEDVRELLAAWAFGALDAADADRVRPHLAGCESCAAEAERLRETVRLLDGPPIGGLPARPATGLPPALLARRPTAPRTAAHAACYAAAVQALRALLPEAEGRWATPVVHDWDVHATVAHLLAADEALAGRLGIPARVPETVLPQDMRWEEAWARRTADVIAHEHARTPGETVASWAGQADALLATPEARDPELAARAELLMGLRLPVADHFAVRAFETWIHTDDIGRALGLVVPPPPEPHLDQLVRLAVRVLGLALGPEATPVLFSVTDGEEWGLGSSAEPVAAELTLDPVDFCLLMGGRTAPEEVPRGATGDAAAVRNVLEAAASLAWL